MKSYSVSVGSTPVTITGNLNWNANGTLAENNIVDGYNSANTQDCKYLYDDFMRVASGVDGTPGVNCLNGSTKIWNQTFSYGSDAFGNLTKSSSGPGQLWAPGYNTANNHYTLAGTLYDSNGNLTDDTFHTYIWLADGHVSTIAPSTHGTDPTNASISYDALGNKVEENVNGTIHEYVSAFGIDAQMMGQTEDSTLVNLPGGVQALYSGGILQRFRYPDWQGTIRAESDPSTRQFTESVAFAPFGERYALQGAPFNVDSFTGKPDQLVSDEYDFPAREEHNAQGRWVSADPVRGTGNKYVYADNNPLSNVDVYGLFTSAGTPVDPDMLAWLNAEMNKPDPLIVAERGDPISMQVGTLMVSVQEDRYLHNFQVAVESGNQEVINPPRLQRAKTEAAQNAGQPQAQNNNTHTITIIEVQGQQGNPANHIVVSVDGKSQVGFGPAKDLTKKQIVKEATGIDTTGTPGKVEPRAAGVKTLDQVTVHVTADQAAHAQAVIDQRSGTPGNYHLTTRNCAEFGEDVLRAGGVKAPTAAVPGELMMELHVEQSLGVAPQ
jgi:RHS repeat-associated protein